MTEDVQNSDLNLDAYLLVGRCDFVSTPTGGGLVYVRRDIRASTLKIKKKTLSFFGH